MNAHLKTMMNVSGIAKRNGRLPLAKAGKVCVNTLMSRLVYPLNHALRPVGIRAPCRAGLRERAHERPPKNTAERFRNSQAER